MAENIVPSVDFFAQEIATELHQDITTQLLKIAERLANFPPEKMSELHLQDWYGAYWKLLDILQYAQAQSPNKEKIANNITAFAQIEANPIRRQYFALALLLFGKIQAFHSFADQNLWSKNLREDFNTFSNFNKLTSLSSNLRVRANVRHVQHVKNFLNNKYASLLAKYSGAEINSQNCPKVAQKDYQIYFCWLQGEENLPPIVQCCYNSLKKNAGKYKICFIDEKNYANYVKLPEYVLQKFMGGGITRTHFSDILRINLLEQYGGLWLDATILVTEPLENYKQFWKLPYYTQKFYQEKSNFCRYISTPSYGRWAGFIQGAAVLHNPLLAFMKEFYEEYWREFDEIIDYVLMDYMIDMAYENIPAVKQELDAIPINNERAWGLLGMLELPYSQYPYDKIFKGNFLNKLNWKKQLDWQKPDTVLKEIQKRYAPETLGE